MKNDRTKSIRFAAIQSEFTRRFFKEQGWAEPDLSTFYFTENNELFIKSTGALKLTKYFKFPQRMMSVFWIVPRFIRDWVYDGIAKRRQRISKGYCVVPSEEERERFL